MWGHLALQAALTQAVRPAMPDKTALKIMSKAIRGAAPVQRQRGVVAGVRIDHQRARPALEELDRVFASAPSAEVEHHARFGLEGPSRVGPHVGLLGLAPARVEQRDRRLVGVNDARAEHERPVRLVQRQQLCAGVPAPGRQRRARRVDSRACVDLLLAVVGNMVNEAADDRVGLQAWRWQRVVEDLRCCRLLDQQLAALAGPLASNLPLHEELRRDDVQPLADVLAHAHHRLAAFWCRAVRVFGLHALVHARQVRRQWLALGLAAWLLVWCSAADGGGLQRGELRLQVGLVGSTGLFEQRALIGVHGFGLGTELPRLEPGKLERDALDLRVAPLDGLGLRVDALALLGDMFALLADVGQHLRSDCAQFIRAERLEVLRFDRLHIKHAALFKPEGQLNIGSSSNCIGSSAAASFTFE